MSNDPGEFSDDEDMEDEMLVAQASRNATSIQDVAAIVDGASSNSAKKRKEIQYFDVHCVQFLSSPSSTGDSSNDNAKKPPAKKTTTAAAKAAAAKANAAAKTAAAAKSAAAAKAAAKVSENSAVKVTVTAAKKGKGG
jgi:hypothetical protein